MLNTKIFSKLSSHSCKKNDCKMYLKALKSMQTALQSDKRIEKTAHPILTKFIVIYTSKKKKHP